eukprot:5425902-Pyramimonas_sp.AAC.1
MANYPRIAFGVRFCQFLAWAHPMLHLARGQVIAGTFVELSTRKSVFRLRGESVLECQLENWQDVPRRAFCVDELEEFWRGVELLVPRASLRAKWRSLRVILARWRASWLEQ